MRAVCLIRAKADRLRLINEAVLCMRNERQKPCLPSPGTDYNVNGRQKWRGGRVRERERERERERQTERQRDRERERQREKVRDSERKERKERNSVRQTMREGES